MKKTYWFIIAMSKLKTKLKEETLQSCIAFCDECALACTIQNQPEFAEQCRQTVRACQNVLEALNAEKPSLRKKELPVFFGAVTQLGRKKRAIDLDKTRKAGGALFIEEGNFFYKVDKCYRATKRCQEALLHLDDALQEEEDEDEEEEEGQEDKLGK